MTAHVKNAVVTIALTLLLLAMLPVFSSAGADAGFKDVGSWQRLADEGFGAGAGNLMAMPMAEFGGALYCGVANQAGARVMRYSGSAWTQVGASGLGDTGNMAITSLAAFGGFLYAGTANMNGCQVWRYNGSNWSQVAGQSPAGTPGTGPGFGSTGNLAVACMETHGSRLYMGTVNINYSVFPINVWSDGAEVWSFDGSLWVREADNGFGDTMNAGVTTLKEFAGELYAGTMRVAISFEAGTLNLMLEGAGCEMRKLGASSWDLVGTQGFGKTGNAALTVMEEYGGDLFLGTANGGVKIYMYFDLTTGQMVMTGLDWHSDGCCVYSYNGSSVTPKVTGGFGDTANIAAFASTSVTVPGNDVLLMGVVGMRGTSYEDFYTRGSLRAFNGTDWYRASADGFGQEYNKMDASLYNRGGQVYVGTLNFERGCEVWRGTPPPEPVPVIVEMTPSAAKAGTQVVIEGEWFDAAQGASTVTFSDGLQAQVVSWSDKFITCLVPEEAVSGDVVVSTARGTSNGYPFEVEGYVWYLAEGCTGGDFETWVLVQNPGPKEVTVDLMFMTSTGLVPGPLDYPIGPGSRHTFWSTTTSPTGTSPPWSPPPAGEVICERAMYGGSRTWAHDSIGVTTAGPMWYLAEGCTGGDFETWVLVQNPGFNQVTVDLTFMTSAGSVDGPQDYLLSPGSRHSFRVNDYVTDWDVSTKVDRWAATSSASGPCTAVAAPGPTTRWG